MIVDFSVKNFCSIKSEQILNLNVEQGRERLASNYANLEDGKLAVVRTAAILGPNASGKSNFLRALTGLSWMVEHSGERKADQQIPCYEPFALSPEKRNEPVEFDIEFIVPSGLRYRYKISYINDRVLTESLVSYPKRFQAVIFDRKEHDTWETIKFGNAYKGGARRFPFFANNSYLSKAGNNASAPEIIREIYDYFRKMHVIKPNHHLMTPGYHKKTENLEAIASLISSADTGIENITLEKREKTNEIRFPDDMPEDLQEAIREQNKTKFSFWHKSENGSLVAFDEEAESDGTIRLFEMLPIILDALTQGGVVLIDEIDAHLHSHLIRTVVDLFHDDEINSEGAQLIFSTHDLGILSSEIMRREQIWLTNKHDGQTSITCLDEFDKKLVRPNSPFHSFYNDGRLGATPRIQFEKIRNAITCLKRTKKSQPVNKNA
ncbi:ATP-binding protein [Pseudovibrio sp. Tun.PSC04-5.I4]|uniref:AAA family ATPase n=1 Tax=Pseudovibrio sp. Tun.PSC04-5.I4 TaxID=1798213 RepID=UPI0008922246|nr:ATP-binding protein [Pseudovibrio sp. Tun.PSC04-5.I4]SDR02482.1 hypothetical protein SAMN04515695_2370 [Pseudovibrio sp. Tun.PSC04-5.I4]